MPELKTNSRVQKIELKRSDPAAKEAAAANEANP
jgi:hypothetical protein